MATIQTFTITPAAFMRQVRNWVEKASDGLRDFRPAAGERTKDAASEYEIHFIAELDGLGTSPLTVFVECRHYPLNHTVTRAQIKEFHGRLHAAGTSKGIIFSTARFQKEALEYAQGHGIGTVRVEDGRKIGWPKKEPRPFSGVDEPWHPNYTHIGWTINLTDAGYEHSELVADNYQWAIRNWLYSPKKE